MTAKTKRSGKQSAEAAEQTKQDILEAAKVLFAQKGFDATSLREIATQADLSHGVIRHHFGSKMDIWLAIAESTLHTYTNQLLPILIEAIQAESALDAFKQVARTFIQLTTANPDMARLMAREGNDKNERSEFFKEHFVVLHAQISDLFNRAQKESKVLQKHTNDSFFLMLMSLTVFPLVVPLVAEVLPVADVNDAEKSKLREDLIMSTLFGE